MGYKQEFVRADLYSADSAPHLYLRLEEDLFPDAPSPITVVSRNVDYSNIAIGSSLFDMMRDLLNKSNYIVPHSSKPWYEQFIYYLRSNPQLNSTLSDGFPTPAHFYPYLNTYLNTSQGAVFCGSLRSATLPLTSPCHNFSLTDNPIVASRFRPFNIPVSTLDDQVASYIFTFIKVLTSSVPVPKQINSIQGLYSDIDKHLQASSFPFAQNYAFYMTFPEMESSWKMYLILAFGKNLSER